MALPSWRACCSSCLPLLAAFRCSACALCQQWSSKGWAEARPQLVAPRRAGWPASKLLAPEPVAGPQLAACRPALLSPAAQQPKLPKLAAPAAFGAASAALLSSSLAWAVPGFGPPGSMSKGKSQEDFSFLGLVGASKLKLSFPNQSWVLGSPKPKGKRHTPLMNEIPRESHNVSKHYNYFY